MSEKKRKKKDGQDKNKNNRRMREATMDVDKKVAGRATGRPGKVKRAHRIDSVDSGYNDFGSNT